MHVLVPLVPAVAVYIRQRFERLIKFQPVPHLARVDRLRFGHAAVLDHLIEQRRRDAYILRGFDSRQAPRGQRCREDVFHLNPLSETEATYCNIRSRRHVRVRRHGFHPRGLAAGE
jgi:hypothetical protein